MSTSIFKNKVSLESFIWQRNVHFLTIWKHRWLFLLLYSLCKHTSCSDTFSSVDILSELLVNSQTWQHFLVYLHFASIPPPQTKLTYTTHPFPCHPFIQDAYAYFSHPVGRSSWISEEHLSSSRRHHQSSSSLVKFCRRQDMKDELGSSQDKKRRGGFEMKFDRNRLHMYYYCFMVMRNTANVHACIYLRLWICAIFTKNHLL